MVIANIPEVHEEATWFLDDFLAKERVQKLVAVQARALNVGHLGVNLGLAVFGYSVILIIS